MSYNIAGYFNNNIEKFTDINKGNPCLNDSKAAWYDSWINRNKTNKNILNMINKCVPKDNSTNKTCQAPMPASWNCSAYMSNVKDSNNLNSNQAQANWMPSEQDLKNACQSGGCRWDETVTPLFIDDTTEKIDDYKNPCPKSHPKMREWNNSGSMWCYEKENEKGGFGNVCNMSKSGIAPPPGKKWGTNQKDCILDEEKVLETEKIPDENTMSDLEEEVDTMIEENEMSNLEEEVDTMIEENEMSDIEKDVDNMVEENEITTFEEEVDNIIDEEEEMAELKKLQEEKRIANEALIAEKKKIEEKIK